jgi:alcohol dehydrogenase (cytochrome c)
MLRVGWSGVQLCFATLHELLNAIAISLSAARCDPRTSASTNCLGSTIAQLTMKRLEPAQFAGDLRRKRMNVKSLLLGAAIASLVAVTASVPALAIDWKDVTEERLVNAESNPDDWLHYGRTYGAQRYSPLKQITTENVSKLKLAYQISLGSLDGQEVTPVVNNGIMILAISHQYIDAIDVKTGNRLWRHEITLPADIDQFACCGRVTKGVSLYGDKVFFGTLDARLIALNAKDGKLVWEKKLEDYKTGYTITMAPTIVKGKVMIGFAGGEFGIIGQILALDTETGTEVWKTSTIPQPGEEGYDTWGKDSTKYGGAASWLTATYDPKLNLTYWGTGNPAPWNAEMRPGDNLFSNSLLALDADTGERKWYFQHVPNDAWDWDSMNEAVHVDIDKDGKKIEAVIQAHKNGFLYTLERSTGKFIQAMAFANVDWGHIDENGKMVVKPGKRPAVGVKATLCPSFFGGKGWAHLAVDPENSMAFIPTMDMCVTMEHEETTYKRGTMYLGASGEMTGPGKGTLTAVDLKTNKIAWSWPNPSPLQAGSALTTAGGLVFVGTLEGNVVALDQKSGKELWNFRSPSGIVGGTISFAAGGKQYIAVASGYGGAFPLWAGKGVPDHIKNNVNKGGVLNVFELGE